MCASRLSLRHSGHSIVVENGGYFFASAIDQVAFGEAEIEEGAEL